MICAHIYDFIRGTRIAVPRPTRREQGCSWGWDIVRPNEQAEQLVFRHVEALAELSATRGQKAAVH